MPSFIGLTLRSTVTQIEVKLDTMALSGHKMCRLYLKMQSVIANTQLQFSLKMSKAKNKALDLTAYLWIRRFRVCMIIVIATYKKKKKHYLGWFCKQVSSFCCVFVRALTFCISTSRPKSLKGKVYSKIKITQ